MIGAPPNADAVEDGVSGDWTVVTAVVGDHDTVCVLFAWPVTVAEVSKYPDADVVTVTVTEAPALSPVTVRGKVEPEGVPALTEPADTEVDHV